MSVRLASVILPVYNQADHIQSVLEDYVIALRRLDFAYELLPVVNGPRRDKSLEICRGMQQQYSEIRTECIDQGGWGGAVRHGLAKAGGDLICYTNSARTTSKDLVLMLLYASVHDQCVVKANRKIRESWRRRLGSLLYNLECRALFDLPYWDVNGTPKVFHRRMAALMELSRNDDLIDLEFHAICRREGYEVIEVPIFSASRHSGRSTTNLGSAYRLYAGALQLHRAMAANGTAPFK
ncbi:MAG TPA: glycosyltransferase [Bryobacteraceae bacterium]|nr:glycosyltransferase [Bryobacteraceae bacterium]